MTDTTYEATIRETSKQLLPWRWAEALKSCHLFWIPARLGSIPSSQREWLLVFFANLADRLESENQLRGELFMSSRTIHENESLKSIYLNAVLSDVPLAGQSRRTQKREQAIPVPKDIDDMAKGKKQYVPYDYVPETAYWFLSREHRELRERYLGYGGLSMLYRKPDDNSAPPAASWPAHVPLIIPKFLRRDPNMSALLEEFDLKAMNKVPAFLRNQPGMKPVFSTLKADKLQERAESLQSSFGAKSKEIFGDGMPRDLTFEGLPFLLPQFTTQDFFASTEAKIRNWFEVFDIYIRESPEDQGVILGCKDNLTSTIAGIIKQMRNDGYHYWEG
jgi:hypothetical protein